ncbi:MAG: hypothetical protein C0523_05135 [Cytophaga sp.]|nr:hypothetical protein [Cytophaga sp.]
MTNKEAYKLISVLMDIQASAGTKLEHAKNQTLKNASAFIEAYNDKLEDLNIDYCSTDDKGNIIRTAQGHYLFTKDNQRALSKELKKFMDSDVIVPFEIVSTGDKKGLSEPLVEYLAQAGFVRERLRVV